MEDLSPAPLPRDAWLATIGAEYLDGFIAAGGATLKLVVLDEAAIGATRDALIGRAVAQGMRAVAIDAATTRLNMPQDLFFALARAMPWGTLTQAFLEALFAANGYDWPHPGQPLGRAALAESLGTAPPLLNKQIDTWLTRAIWQERAYAQDFRAALLTLCAATLDEDPALADPARLWLHGESVAPATLRGLGIGGRIGRGNARAMLISLCHWVRAAGASGLLVCLDASRLAHAGPVAEGTLRYSPAAVMDTYEVLRELIDDAEHLPGLFVAVLTGAALIGGEPKRRLDHYDALKMRVWPDVRPGAGQNPLAPMVWIGP